MKITNIFILCSFFSISLFAADNEQRIKAEIKEATVYLNAAKLSITCQATIPAGPSVVIIENLPNGINQESIQLNAKGDFVILSVNYGNNYLKELKRTRQAEKLNDSLDVLNDKLEILNGKTIVLQKEEEMILKNQSLSGNNVGFKVEDLAKLADFYRKSLGQINEEKIVLKKQIKELDKKIYSISSQITEVNQGANTPSGEIRVSVTSKTAVQASLSCDFLVYNAGWEPLYDIRAKNTSSPVQVNFKAKVFQNSGMEWKNVKLTLSTTNPTISGNKPILNPWYLDIYQRPVYRSSNSQGWGGSDGKKMKLAESEMDRPQLTMEESQFASEQASSSADYTAVAQTALSVEYEISIPYTIPSSGKQEVVDIQNYTVNAFYQYGCVPKLDTDAFLMAGLTGWEKLSLLPGNSNIYFESSYVGQAYIDPQNTSDTLFISLGRDKKIVVKRETVKDFTSKKVIGTNKKDEYGYEIIIRNTKQEAIDLEIEEQMPISQNSDIVVEMMDKSEAKYDIETGKLTWKLKVNASETKKIRFRFSVKYPKNKQVSGL
ncbi:MAG: DUF4139 domain-containing protein [Opitutaceae bacterium]|nr:DUF4139 domain-containing protein [Cytophagales bacterium]